MLMSHLLLSQPSNVWLLRGQSSHLVWQIAIGLIYVVGMRMTSAQVDQEFERLDKAILLAIRAGLNHAGLCDKSAAAIIGMDVKHFQQALRGDGFRKIAITNLGRLPWSFWACFFPALASIVLRQHCDELVDAAKEVVGLERRVG
jgi:hypothetical protein